MPNQDISRKFDEAKPQIAKHWRSCRDAGLTGHSTAMTAKVDRALEDYVAALAGITAKSRKKPIMKAMKALFARLDEINREAKGALLETDEREVLVPIITDLAEAAGLDVDEFSDGDPTFEFRNF